MPDTMNPSLCHIVETWTADARLKLEGGAFGPADLDRLLEAAASASGSLRQRLLYLHTASPNIQSPLVGGALYEPEVGAYTQIDPLAPELPYKNVHDAIVNGWRVIHFPQQLAPFDDREIDLIGYEFILEKMEVYHA